MRCVGYAVLLLLVPAVCAPCTLVVRFDPAPIEEQWRRAFCAADLVFIGVADEVIPLDASSVHVEISPIWGFKGLRQGRNANTKYEFSAVTDSAMCGRPYEQGETYLVVAQTAEGAGQITPRPFTLPLRRSADMRAYFESLPAEQEVCSVGDSVETPNFLLPTIWREELLEAMRSGADGADE